MTHRAVIARTKHRLIRADLKNNFKLIFVLALPVVVENILQTLLGTTDTYFAGQLHDNAIAAIGVTNLIMNVLIAFFAAVSVGCTAVIARNYGRKDVAKTTLAAKQAVILGLCLGLGIGLISLVFSRPILRISGAEAAVMEYAVPYYLVVAVPSLFLCMSLVLSSCLRAVKDTKTPMLANGAAIILNIMLNWLFMQFGFGIIGLAVATTISRIVTVLILLTKFKADTISIDLFSKDWRPNGDMLRKIARIGIPSGIEKLIMRTGQLVYNGMIISLGTTLYVAHNIGGAIENYAYIPAMGFGVAIATLVGVSLGENDPQKARKLTFLTSGMNIVLMSLVGAVFFIFAPQFAAVFTDTAEVQAQVVLVLRFIAFFQPFAALTQTCANALYGAGDTKFPMFATLIGIWVLRVGGGYFFAITLDLGLLGVWAGYALDITVRSIVLMIRFLCGKWQRVEI